MGLLSALTDAAGDGPEAVRIVDRSLSRERLLGCAAAVAAEIRGARAVAVDATASMETVVAVVAGIMAGVPVVPVPSDSGVRERSHILRDSGAAVLLTTGAGGEDADLDLDLPRLRVDLSREAAAGFPDPPEDRPALILYTSGTTGLPKGVLVSHAAIAADLDALAQAWEWTSEDLLVHGLPLFHVHGLVLGVLGPLRIGSRLHHTGRPRPDAYAAAGGSLYFGVPTVWSRMCEDPVSAGALSRARLLVSGSAPLPTPVFAGIASLTGHRPVERYGMTETLITVSTLIGDRRPGYVGRPLAGVRTRLADEHGAIVPHDGQSLGELQVRSPTMYLGYHGQPETTAGTFSADGWFGTGDIAVIEPDGWHRIVGRASTDLIKSGGYRIGAGEVENVLLSHPAVGEAAVVGTPHADLGEQVTAYVVAHGVTERELIDFVAGQLSAHKRPRRVVMVDALPRNAMGKVQKKLLKEL